MIVFLRHRFQIFVDGIDSTGSVHPADAGIESLIDKKLAPGRRAVSVETLFTYHL